MGNSLFDFFFFQLHEINCTPLNLISILSTCVFRVHTSLSAPKTGRSGPSSDPTVPRQTKQWCGVTSSWPETDGWLDSEAATMAKVTSPALCAHLHPNTPVVIFIPAAPLSYTHASTHAAQCLWEKMNHLDSAAVCHTMLHAAPARRAKHLQGNQDTPRTEKNFKTFVKRCGMFPGMLIEEIPCFANHDASRTIRKKKMADLKESNSSVQE